MTFENIAHLDEGIFKHKCVLEISRSQGTIMVRVEKNGKSIAFGEGGNLSAALERANAAYLKLLDKYAAQIARFDAVANSSSESDKLTSFIKSGGHLCIKRKGFSPLLLATASDWEGNIVCERHAPILESVLRILEFSRLY